MRERAPLKLRVAARSRVEVDTACVFHRIESSTHAHRHRRRSNPCVHLSARGEAMHSRKRLAVLRLYAMPPDSSSVDDAATSIAAPVDPVSDAAAAAAATSVLPEGNPLVVDILFFVAAVLLILATVVVVVLNVSYYRERKQLLAEDDQAYKELGYGERDSSTSGFGIPVFLGGDTKKEDDAGNNSVGDDSSRTAGPRDSQLASTSKGFGRKKPRPKND